MQRTRSSLIFVVATLILCHVCVTIGDESPSDRKSAGSEEAKLPEKSGASISKNVIENNTNNDTAVERRPIVKNITSQLVSTIVNNKSVTVPSPEPTKDGHQPAVNSGALLRGVYVLGGLSVIALAYMVFRSFGVNKQRPQMVRKYGILAHKQDIEMRPLPLDEDDDDDTTVFDVSGLASPRPQS